MDRKHAATFGQRRGAAMQSDSSPTYTSWRSKRGRRHSDDRENLWEKRQKCHGSQTVCLSHCRAYGIHRHTRKAAQKYSNMSGNRDRPIQRKQAASLNKARQ